ncbi:MAG: PhoH family protein [Dehalococcoidia bacterium]|nr:PhoH family protein [Dehalococcoidia bacterium]
MNKVYVFDTNVLLHDASSIERFGDNTVAIPLVVLDEIDKFKGRQDAVGRNAREATRILDGMRGKGSLVEGVSTAAGGVIKIIVDGLAASSDLPEGLDKSRVDNQILRVCLGLKESLLDVTLITKDINMRLRADALGIRAENYLERKAYQVPHAEAYAGIIDVTISEEELQTFYRERTRPLPEGDLFPNEFVQLRTSVGKVSAIGQVSDDKGHLVLVNTDAAHVWGIRSRNLRQTLVFKLLLDPNIALVTLTGQAGTGKTLLTLAAGLDLVLDAQRYKKMLVSRPIIAFGKEIGYLPGDKDEKMNPWMAAIYDNLELLMSNKGGGQGKKANANMAFIQKSDIFEVEALTYIRGRSIPNQYMIIDEAQNLTPHEIKTIISRVGEGTKLVLTGDVSQIDNPFLDELSNGLTYAIERLKGSPMVGHLTLDKGERSPLAELAASRL